MVFGHRGCGLFRESENYGVHPWRTADRWPSSRQSPPAASDAAHAEVLHFKIVFEAVAGTFPPDAGLFYPTEGLGF